MWGGLCLPASVLGLCAHANAPPRRITWRQRFKLPLNSSAWHYGVEDDQWSHLTTVLIVVTVIVDVVVFRQLTIQLACLPACLPQLLDRGTQCAITSPYVMICQLRELTITLPYFRCSILFSSPPSESSPLLPVASILHFICCEFVCAVGVCVCARTKRHLEHNRHKWCTK